MTDGAGRISRATAETLFRCAVRALATGRAEAGLDIAEAAAASHPSCWALAQLASLYESAGRIETARQTLHLAAEKYPWEALHVPYYLALLAARTGDYDAGARGLEQFAAHSPTHDIIAFEYQLGSIYAMQRRFAEANALFGRGSLITCGDLKKTTMRVLRFPDASAGVRVPVPLERSLVLEAQPRVPPGTEAVYFVACDSRYFELFAEALCNSLATRCGIKCVLHVHLVNPGAGAEATLARLRRRGGIGILASRETVRLDQLDERQRRTYYACARFLLLPELHARYGLPMVVADIDQLVLRSLRPLLDDLAPHDVSLLAFPRCATNVLSLISATALLLNAEPGARRFAETVRDVLAERMADPACFGWHLDQAALAVGYLLLRDVRFHLLQPEIVDSQIDPHRAAQPPAQSAVFWSITMAVAQNVAKLGLPLFREFLAGSADGSAEQDVAEALREVAEEIAADPRAMDQTAQ